MPLIRLFRLRADLGGALGEGTWREHSQVGVLFKLDSCSSSPSRDHGTGFMRDSEGLTWGRAGGGQLVLAPEPFVEVQGQWDPGGGVGKSYSLGKTWDPDQSLAGGGGVMSSPGLGFGFPCGGSSGSISSSGNVQ